ncbi:hypothetical protein PMAYCL1PPCAC_22279, partial [Pristionchus mayeri]
LLSMPRTFVFVSLFILSVNASLFNDVADSSTITHYHDRPRNPDDSFDPGLWELSGRRWTADRNFDGSWTRAWTGRLFGEDFRLSARKIFAA